MTRTGSLTFICLITCLLAADTLQKFSARVISVTDGDTIKVLHEKKQVTIRLEGIDAPEKTQAFGSKSRQALSKFVFGKTVTVNQTGTDRYGRMLARIQVDGQDVSAKMVQDGWAWHFKKYSKEQQLADLEIKARESETGLWADTNALPPWEYRDRQTLRKKTDSTPEVVPEAVRTPITAEPPQRSTPREISNKSPSPVKSNEPFTNSHWLNISSSVRHNASCEWFSNTKRGRFCGPDEGRACKLCGG